MTSPETNTSKSAPSDPVRPKLLFLSQTLPYPPDGGVKIRTFHTLRILAQAFDVTALCFFRWKPSSDPDESTPAQRVQTRLKTLGELGKVEAFPIPQEHVRRRLYWDHARSLLSRRAYTVFTYESADFRSRLHGLFKSFKFDLVHADSLDLSGYFSDLPNVPLICVHHDAQSQLLRRRSAQEPKFSRRAYLKLQARLMEREERLWCPRVSLNITVSEVDKQLLRDVAGHNADFEVIPNGVDIDAFQPSDERIEEPSLVFVGGTTWFPNLDALTYFSADILPLLREQIPQVQVTWVGRASPEEIEHWNTVPGLTLTGYVDKIQPYVHKAACYIVPLRVGGGTRLKILDAWAMGKAVVSTSIGCEGLMAIDEENILVRDKPEDFVSAICDVITKPRLRNRLGREARNTAVAQYSWDSIGQHMLERYHALLQPD